LEQGQADWRQTSTATKARLVNQDPFARPGGEPCGCDVVALKVEDVAPNGYAIDRATVRQKKPADRSNLSRQTKPAKRSTTISEL
jgi:hypothetical protein